MKSKLSESYVKNWYEEKVMKIKELRIEMTVKLNKGLQWVLKLQGKIYCEDETNMFLFKQKQDRRKSSKIYKISLDYFLYKSLFPHANLLELFFDKWEPEIKVTPSSGLKMLLLLGPKWEKNYSSRIQPHLLFVSN